MEQNENKHKHKHSLRLIVCERLPARLLPVFCIAAWPFLAGAQTTIGSGTEPARGALLELKTQEAARPANLSDDANVTSTEGGLLLPRLKLVNPLTLEPMVSSTDPDWLDNNLTKIKERHVGLTVYNLANNKDFKPGIYSWNGSRWMPAVFSSLKPGNGIVLADDSVHFGGSLVKPAAIGQGDYTTKITGLDSVLVSAPLTLSGPLRFIDGNETAGHVLMSDTEGNALWEDPQILPPTPLAVIAAGSAKHRYTAINGNKWIDTGASVTLPEGRWFVAVTMHAKLQGGNIDSYNNYNDWIWLRSAFFADGESQLNRSYFEGPSCYVSGRLSGGESIINGHLVIRHSNATPIKFKYMVGGAEVGQGIKADSSRIELSEFADSNNKASSIVVFALAE